MMDVGNESKEKNLANVGTAISESLGVTDKERE